MYIWVTTGQAWNCLFLSLKAVGEETGSYVPKKDLPDSNVKLGSLVAEWLKW